MNRSASLLWMCIAAALAGCSSSTTLGTNASTSTGAATSSAGSTTGGSTGGQTSGGTGSTTGAADAGLLGVGDPCDPTASSDPCAASGLECTAGSSTATCQLPDEGFPCFPSLGCDFDLVCTPGLASGFQPSDAGNAICLLPCSSAALCQDPTLACKPGPGGTQVCRPVFCGPGFSGSYLGTCSSQGSGDGLCVPDPSGAFGVCLQSGTVALDQPCNGLRTPTLDQLCVAGAICEFAGMGAFCAPICSVGVGSKTCDAGSTCFQIAGFPVPADYGICLQDCDQDAGSCPTPLSCQSYPDSDGGPHSLECQL